MFTRQQLPLRLARKAMKAVSTAKGFPAGLPAVRKLQRFFWRTTDRLVAREVRRLEDEAFDTWRRSERSASALSQAHDGPLVSIIMPTWNRAQILPAAVRSVLGQRYPHWELLIVDDGSTDETKTVVEASCALDARIRYLPTAHSGHAAARNVGLAASAGEIIAYLDTDNVWYSHYLEEVVAELAAQPQHDSVYLAQLVCNRAAGEVFVRSVPFDSGDLARENFVDLNVFAHRRALFTRHGGFDESLTRLADWDLIRRYTKDAPPVQSSTVGGRYETHAQSVTGQESSHYNQYKLLRRDERPIDRPLRVLYALWHYPQLSETYVRWEIAYMRRRGVEVEVWSELRDCPAPFQTDVKIHHGSIASAIAAAKPDLVHVHWCNRAEHYADAVAAAGLPMTIRDHAFDLSADLVRRLGRDGVVRRIYVFPHWLPRLPGIPTLRPLPVGFSADAYFPSAQKDHKLVLRVGAALPTKDFETFFHAAQRCREHRFVLIVVLCQGEEAYLGALQRQNAALGNPVDLRVNVQTEDVAKLVAQAGIYLHTHGLATPYGMPVSIAEAMATGAYVIGRRCPGSEAYVGSAGALYRDQDEAVQLIQATTRWSDEQWRVTALRAVEHAFEHFVDARVWPPLLDDWLDLTSV